MLQFSLLDVHMSLFHLVKSHLIVGIFQHKPSHSTATVITGIDSVSECFRSPLWFVSVREFMSQITSAGYAHLSSPRYPMLQPEK
jgi:hypothetical protein